MNYLGHGCGMGFGMWFIPILLAFILFYFLKENDKNKKETTPAQDILDRRYANSEIDTQEYEEKSNILKKTK